jgi:hypothetical protein
MRFLTQSNELSPENSSYKFKFEWTVCNTKYDDYNDFLKITREENE